MSTRKSQRSKAKAAAPASAAPTSKPAVPTPTLLTQYPYLNALALIPLLALVSLSNIAAQLALRPIYGSTVASLWFQPLLALACAISMFRPSTSAHSIFVSWSFLLAGAPLLEKLIGSYTATWKNAVWGPVVTQCGVVLPIVSLAGVLARDQLVSPGSRFCRVLVLIGLGSCFSDISYG